MAGLSDADQNRFPLPRFNPGSAYSFGSCAVFRSRTARRYEGNPGVAFLLFQIAANRSRALSRARRFHSIDETEEHLAVSKRRRLDHSSRPRVLRLIDKIC